MSDPNANTAPIMRLFEVHAKPGCKQDLLAKFATTSADVVRDEPGNEGYFFGDDLTEDDDIVIFASFWSSLDAVKARFGADWQTSFLPEGYEEMIRSCSVRHICLRSGLLIRP